MARNSKDTEMVEIEDMETWNSVIGKNNEDLNVIDVYPNAPREIAAPPLC
jgi:hypothetical protein